MSCSKYVIHGLILWAGLVVMGCGSGVAPLPPAANIAFSTNSLAFANTSIGQASAAQIITVRNTGLATLEITSIALSNLASYTMNNVCGSTLPSGSSCGITVVFRPQTTGTLAATVTLADNSGGHGAVTQTITLTAVGIPPPVPQAVLSATSIAFSPTLVGTLAPLQMITLTNPGTGPLVVNSIALSGAGATSFADSGTCGTTVAPGSTCTLSISFRPATATGSAALVTITDNANNLSGAIQTIALAGSGKAPQIILSADSFTFPDTALGTTAAGKILTLKNLGNSSLTIGSISLRGSNSADFAEVDHCVGTLAAGDACSISTTFTPSTAGPEQATLTIVDDDGNVSGSIQTTTLAGSGKEPKGVLSSPGIDFPDTLIRTVSMRQTVTLTNSGNAPLHVGSVLVGGADATAFTISNTCTGVVAAGASCSLSSTFSPLVPRSYSALVTIADDAANAMQVFSLSGNGVAPQASLSASSVAFPATTVGDRSSQQTVTLSNPGNAPLTITGIALGAATSHVDYYAFGDSITTGAAAADPVSESFTVLVANATMASLVNRSLSGMMACDQLPSIASNSIMSYAHDSRFYTNMIGTNDVDVKGTGPYERTFQTCHQATLAWLATPRENLVRTGDYTLQGSGGWDSATNPSHIYAAFAASAGTLTTKLTTYGSPLYGWYELDDNASPTSCFQIAIDDAPPSATFCTLLGVKVDTVNGVTKSLGFIRLAVAAGQHTIVASTTTGGVAILGFGTLPVSAPDLPLVLSADIPNQAASNAAHGPAIAAYNSDVLADEDLLRADGANIRHVPDDRFMLGTALEMADPVHPNTLGHRHLADAFLSIFPAADASAKPFVQSTNCGATLAEGDSCHITITFSPGTASTAYLGTLTVTDNSANLAGSVQTVTLSGLGTLK